MGFDSAKEFFERDFVVIAQIGQSCESDAVLSSLDAADIHFKLKTYVLLSQVASLANLLQPLGYPFG